MAHDLGHYPSDAVLCVQRQLNGALYLSISGEVGLANVAVLRVHLSAAARTEKNLILDLGGLYRVDSAGLNALLDAHRVVARAGRSIALVAPSPMIQRFLSVLAIGPVMPVFPTVDAAMHSFRARPEPR